MKTVIHQVTHLRIEQISYKYSSKLEKCIDITRFKNGLVVFVYIEDKQRNIHSHNIYILYT